MKGLRGDRYYDAYVNVCCKSIQQAATARQGHSENESQTEKLCPGNSIEHLRSLKLKLLLSLRRKATNQYYTGIWCQQSNTYLKQKQRTKCEVFNSLMTINLTP